jgi:hypothetical protein
MFAYADMGTVGQLQRAMKEDFISLEEAVHADNKNELQEQSSYRNWPLQILNYALTLPTRD